MDFIEGIFDKKSYVKFLKSIVDLTLNQYYRSFIEDYLFYLKVKINDTKRNHFVHIANISIIPAFFHLVPRYVFA